MDKKTVNIYIATSIRGPARRDGRYLYILETDTAAGLATISKRAKLEDTTENQSALYALCEALNRIKRPCLLEIHTDCLYLAAALTKGWVTDWRYAGWQNKKGQPIADVEKWAETSSLLGVHDFKIHLKEPHSYREWMVRELHVRAGQ